MTSLRSLVASFAIVALVAMGGCATPPVATSASQPVVAAQANPVRAAVMDVAVAAIAMLASFAYQRFYAATLKEQSGAAPRLTEP